MTDRDLEMMVYYYPARNECDYGNEYDLQYINDMMGVLKGLTNRERKLLTMRFGLEGETPINREGRGDFFNVTKERIDQIEKRALKKLKKCSSQKQFQKYYKGKAIPNWIWSVTMHEYSSIEDTENPSDDSIETIPLPWKNKVDNLAEFEQRLNRESFRSILKTIGYDSQLPEEERHDVIRYAVYTCGVEKIEKNLKVIISTSNEERKRIYTSDLEFLKKDEACQLYRGREDDGISEIMRDEHYKIVYIENDVTIVIKSRKRDRFNTFSIIKIKGIPPIILLSITWEELYLVEVADQLTLETEKVAYKFYNVDYSYGEIDVYIYDEAIELLRDMIEQDECYLSMHIDGNDDEEDKIIWFDREEVLNIYKGYMKINKNNEDISNIKIYHPYSKIEKQVF